MPNPGKPAASSSATQPTPAAHPYSEASDVECMKEFQLGDERGFEELYRRHASRVRAYLRSRLNAGASARLLSGDSSADDLLQSVFLKLHTTRHQYDPELNFLPWLFTITRSVMIDALRSRDPAGNISPSSEELLARLPAPTEPQQESSVKASILDRDNLNQANLSESQQAALKLKYEEDLEFEEIARRLSTSPTNVRQLVSRGVRKLQSWYAKRGSVA